MDTSIAVKMWMVMFGDRFGIPMPMRGARMAQKLCSDSVELSDIMSQFSDVFPSVFTSIDNSFLQNMNSVFMQLKCNQELRDESVDDKLRPDSAVLCMDDRVTRDGDALDVCFNPTLMATLWASTVVYLCQPTRECAIAASKIIGAILPSRGPSLVVMVAGVSSIEEARRVLDPFLPSEYNVPVFPTPSDGRSFSACMPKVVKTFWCVSAEGDVDTLPSGASKSLNSNILVTLADVRIEDKQALDRGFGRLLVMDNKWLPLAASGSGEVLRGNLPTNDDVTLKFLVAMHQGHDGSQRSKGNVAFVTHALYHDSKITAFPDDNSDRVAILGIETRKNPVLLACLRTSAARCHTHQIVLVLCCSDESVEQYYVDGLPKAFTKVLRAPESGSFLRQKAFSMQAYNRMMAGPEFWKFVSSHVSPTTTHVVTVQDDGGVFRDVPPGQMNRYLSYDYIGAPWHQGNDARLRELCPDLVGNGGVSIRSLKACLQAVESSACREVRRQLLCDKFDMPEDVAIVHALHQLGHQVAPRGIAEEFSSEQVLIDDSHALHKPWLYHDFSAILRYLNDIERGIDA